MILFYDIDEKYVKWLQKIDPQVPNIVYSSNNKFLCGTVLEIDGTKFYAPISSNTQVFRTSFPIVDDSIPTTPVISTIRLSFMIPADGKVLTKKKFSDIRKIDPAYADLLEKEWKYCRKHEADIYAKALKVYKIGCNHNHKLNYTCCNFKMLKEKYQEYV